MIFQFTQDEQPAISRYKANILPVITAVATLTAFFVLSTRDVSLYITIPLLVLSVVLPFVLIIKENRQLQKRNRLLAAQQQYLANAVINVNEGVIVTDGSGRIHYMNPAAEKITGNTLKQARHRQLKEIYNTKNEKTGQPVESVVARVLTTGVAILNENNTVITNRDNEKLIITNSCSPLYSGNGDIQGAVLVFKDSTKTVYTERKLKIKEKESSSLIEHLPQAVYTCDENGYIQVYNKAAAILWGREPQLNKDKWCGTQKMFYLDGSPVSQEDCPTALTVKQKRSLPPAEMIIQQPNGSRRQVIIYPTPLFNEEGILTGAVTMLLDVTEKKYNEQLAVFNEDKYRSLVEQASEAIFITDSEGNLLEINEQASLITGYTKEELKSVNIARLFPKDDFENNFIVFKKIAAGGHREVREFTALHKNKTLLTLLISAKRMSDGRLMAIVKDLTESKKTERSLEESEQLNVNILTSVSSHIAVINGAGLVVTANKAWNDFRTKNGITILERCAVGENFIVNTRLAAACGDKISEAVLDGLAEVLSGRLPLFEYEYSCPVPDRLRWFLIRITQFAGNSSKLVISHVDITERKNAEKETGDYRFALDQSSIVDVSDSDGIITYVNDNFCKATGYTRTELLGKSHKILNSGYHTPGFYKLLWDTVTSGKVWTGEVRNRNKDGSILWVDTTIVPFVDTAGKPVQFITIRSNISRRKAAEEKMQVAMERFQFLSHATSDIIWDWDIENDKVLYNDGISKILGYRKPEVSNVRDWWEQSIHADDILQVNEAISDAVAGKKQNLQLEYRFRCEDGSYKYFYDRAFILYTAAGKAFRMIGAMQDITYKKEEEQRISKAVSDAQEAERQYLGMELHDNINQLLTGTLLMLGAACHAPMRKEEVVKIAENCKLHLTTAVEEIRNLSHRLAPAAFTTSLQHEVVTLVTEMSHNGNFIASHQFNGINEKHLSPEIKICLYRILQEQLSNISKHSRAQHVHVSLLQKHDTIILKIADDGVGFDPKTQSGGIGLGNIKKRTGYFSGRFTLSTAPGKGCCIETAIPLKPVFPKPWS